MAHAYKLNWTSEAVKPTADNSKSTVRLVMACPLSKKFNKGAGACPCPKTSHPWFHLKCGEPDFIDNDGNVHCSASCSQNGRSIFEC